MKMKIYELNEFGIDNLKVAEYPVPAISDNEVLVRFHAWSLNYRDLMVVRGEYNPRATFPLTPLSDGAGEVVAVGESVKRWKVGDRVCPIFAQCWIDGGFTAEKSRTALGGGGSYQGVAGEYGKFDASGLVEIPGHLSYEEAATLPCAAVTAWHALAVSGDVKPGDSVLTLGTGGVSVFAVQFAKMLGAHVIATSSSDEKLGRIKDLGADEVINYREREDWDKAVLELTGKVGVDHVVEVGGAGTLSRSVRAVKYGGHIAVIGVLTKGTDFSPTPVLMKGIKLQGILVGSLEMFEEMNRAIGKHGIRPVIDRTFRFDELPGAMRYMESAAHFGKVVITND